MKFDDIYGNIEVQPAELQRFIRRWFTPGDNIALVGMAADKAAFGFGSVMSQAANVNDMMAFTEDDLAALSIAKEHQINSYMTIFPVKDTEKIEIFKRGQEDNVGRVLGTFADFDVKPGCFSSKEEIIKFLTEGSIPKPTIIVENGPSGGIHSYWKLFYEDEEKANRDLLEQWWTFIAETAKKEYNASIDRLIDMTRISRMPGGVYWPKKTSSGKVGVVTIVSDDGPIYSLEKMLSDSQGAFDRRRDKIHKVWTEDNQKRLQADDMARILMTDDDDEWGPLYAIAHIEEIFNSMFTWDDILVHKGWTFIREDNKGRREWERPGGKGKSATTDYIDSPDMMSLLSSSEETGLADLHEAGMPLTKFRVATRLIFNDDLNAFISFILQKKKEQGS